MRRGPRTWPMAIDASGRGPSIDIMRDERRSLLRRAAAGAAATITLA